MDDTKNILVVAQNRKTEALRMATGLTLLDDLVHVAVVGELDESDQEVQIQMEALDFSDVPLERITLEEGGRLGELVTWAEAVYVI